jgi:hypothetical protein
MVQLASIPASLQWHTEPMAWQVSLETLKATTKEKTDLFIDPQGPHKITNANEE